MQHIKTEYGQGYSLKIQTSNPESVPLRQFVEKTFPGSRLVDVNNNQLNYEVPQTKIDWAYLFGAMERAKSTFDIEEYFVTQATLEQIFIGFAQDKITVWFPVMMWLATLVSITTLAGPVPTRQYLSGAAIRPAIVRLALWSLSMRPW